MEGASATQTPSSATFYGDDSLTRGNWEGRYGLEGFEIIGDTRSDPAYAEVSAAGATFFAWDTSATDVPALARPDGTSRLAATWFANRQFTVDLNLTDGKPHRVSFYFLDWDQKGRAEQIEVLDPAGRVLDRRFLQSFEYGTYLTWDIQGQVTVRFIARGADNAVLSGIFFDVRPSVTGESLGVWPGFPRGDCRTVTVVGDRAYASIGPGLMILDVSDPAQIRRLGGFDTSGWITGLQVMGNLAYVAAGHAGVVVLDVSDPASVRWIGRLPTRQDAYAVQVVGNLVYVGEGRPGPDTFSGDMNPGSVEVFDVSDPANASRLGSFETGRVALALRVVGNLAYVAARRAGLEVWDVSNPSICRRLGLFDTSGEARDVEVIGKFAYVADYFGGIQVLDVSDPTNLRRVGGIADQRGVAWAVTVSRNWAFVAYEPPGVLVLDVSDPANPRVVQEFDISGYSSDVEAVGNRLYAACLNGGLQVLDVSDPAKATLLGSFATSGRALRAQMVGDRVYVADEHAGLQILDIGDTAKVRRLGGFAASGGVRDVQVVGDLAYVAGDRFAVLDVSDAGNPRRLGISDTTEWPRNVCVVGNLAYVTTDTDRLEILDVSDATKVRRLGGFGNGAERIQVIGNRAYLGETGYGFQVLDVSDPRNVQRLGFFYGNTGQTLDVQVVANRAYVATFGGLHILDVNDPIKLRQIGLFGTDGGTYGVKVAGALAYLSESEMGLRVLDVSDPANVRYLGGFDTPGQVYDVHLVGNLAVVADGTAGVQVMRLLGGPGFAPGILAGPKSTEATIGGTATLQVSAAGTEPLHYQWRKDGVDLLDGPQVSGSRTALFTINNLEADDFGSYSVVVSNQAGTVATAPATLRFDDRFQVVFTKADFRSDQGKLFLRISGAPAGETVILSSSLDLINWVPWLTNAMPAGAWEAQVPGTEAESHRFFRALRQR